MPPKLLADLPADVVQHILVRLTLAHHIARIAPTCKVVSVAARNAIKVRQFSSEVVTLAGHQTGESDAEAEVTCVAAAVDGRVITASDDNSVMFWRDGVCERTIVAHASGVYGLAVLPGGAFVTVSFGAKLWTLDGALERTFELRSYVNCVAAMPDGVHFVVLPPLSSRLHLHSSDFARRDPQKLLRAARAALCIPART